MFHTIEKSTLLNNEWLLKYRLTIYNMKDAGDKMYNLLSFGCSRPPVVWKEVGETRPEKRNFKLICPFYDTMVAFYGTAGAAETNRRGSKISWNG